MPLAFKGSVLGTRDGFGKLLGRNMHKRDNFLRCTTIHDQHPRGYSGSSFRRYYTVFAHHSSVVGKCVGYCFH